MKTNFPERIYRVSLALLLILSAVPARAQTGAAARYNLISIVTDDQGMWSIGAYGNREARTPHMDRLAREGARFLNAFVTTPVCSPSRAGFMTGLYGTQVGIRDWISPKESNEGMGLPVSALMWPEVLQRHGWRTGLFGKWHLGTQPRFHPTKRGFDTFFGELTGGFNPMNPKLERNGQVTQMQGAASDLVMDEALQFIEANKSKPFAALIHFREPHTPYGPMPEQDTALFRDLDPVIPQVKGLDPAHVKRLYREYYAAVHAVDRNIGRLLAQLETSGLAQNTIVMFTSDHGYNIGHHGIETKGNGHWITGGVTGPKRPNLFDTSLRIPLLVRWPGVIIPGMEISETALQLDTFASTLGMLGVAAPAGVRQNGRDFTPLLRGEKIGGWRDHFFGQYDLHNGGLAFMRMVRTSEWKLVRHYLADQLDELYDLRNDPGELKNLYNAAAHGKTRAQLQQRLDTWMKSIDDPLLKMLAGENKAPGR